MLGFRYWYLNFFFLSQKAPVFDEVRTIKTTIQYQFSYPFYFESLYTPRNHMTFTMSSCIEIVSDHGVCLFVRPSNLNIFLPSTETALEMHPTPRFVNIANSMSPSFLRCQCKDFTIYYSKKCHNEQICRNCRNMAFSKEVYQQFCRLRSAVCFMLITPIPWKKSQHIDLKSLFT